MQDQLPSTALSDNKVVKYNASCTMLKQLRSKGSSVTYVAFSLVQMEPLVSTGEFGLKTLSVRSMKVWFL